MLLSWKFDNNVIGFHLLAGVSVQLIRDLPQVLLIVKDLDVLHVIRLVHGRLDLKEIFGITHMGLYGVRHLIHRFEQVGEYLPKALDDRIRLIDYVEICRPGIGVDHNLDSVPCIIDFHTGLFSHPSRVGIHGCCGICVHHPDQVAVRDHQIGVPIKAEKGGDLSHPKVDRPVEHDPALRLEIAGEENLRIPERRGKEKSSKERVDRYAALPLIGRVHIAVPLWIVELLGLGPDNDVVSRLLAIIDLGPIDVHTLAHGREVFDQETRQPFLGDLIDRTHRQAVAMSIFQVSVHPRFRLCR